MGRLNNKQDWLAKIAASPYGLQVYRKYCPQLHKVSILRKLIKQGKTVRTRVGTRSCKHTVLNINVSSI